MRHEDRPASPIGRLVAPIDEQAFFDDFWRRAFTCVRGDESRFAELLPWRDLNRVLNQHRLPSDQLKLFRAGVRIPPSDLGVSDDGPLPPRPPVARIEAELRRGATLVLNRVHTLHEPVCRLAEDLEFAFGAPVGVNAYVSFGATNGLPPHLDDHEVFILQVSGRKHWRLFGFSNPPGVLSTQVPESVIWDDILDEGDLLYIPRGCWHVAEAVDGPSLHLTISVSYPTVADILAFAVEELRRSEAGQVIVPRDPSGAERGRLDELLRTAIGALGADELISSYFRNADATRSGLPHFSLPRSVEAETSAGDATKRYRLTGRRRPVIEDAPPEIIVRISNGTWRYPRVMRRLLECLSDRAPMTVAEISSGTALAPEVTRSLLLMLLSDGLVCVC